MNNALRDQGILIKTVENQMAVVRALDLPRPDAGQFSPALETRTSQARIFCQCLQGGLDGVDLSFGHYGTGLFPIPVNLF